MKKICMILICCIILISLPVYASETCTAVIKESERVANISFIPDKTPFAAADNVCIRAVSSSDPAEDYDQPAFFKFDISDYSDSDINSVLLVWKSSAKNSLRVYDVPGDSLSVDYSGETPNRIKIGSVITSEVFPAGAPALENLPGIPEGYNLSFDLTSYVKSKLSEGKTSFTVMIYSNWAGRYVFTPGGAMLWLDYSVNNKPKINITSPSDTVNAGEPFDIAAEITDSDGSIKSAQFLFDGKKCSHTVSKNIYRASVSGDEVTEGEHTVTVTAADNDGAESTVTKKIFAQSFNASKAVITDDSGKTIDFQTLCTGDKIIITTDITSLTTTTLPVAVFAGMYTDRNEMKAFAADFVSFDFEGETKTVTLALSVPHDIDPACASVRVYASNGRKSVTAAVIGKGE